MFLPVKLADSKHPLTSAYQMGHITWKHSITQELWPGYAQTSLLARVGVGRLAKSQENLMLLKANQTTDSQVTLQSISYLVSCKFHCFRESLQLSRLRIVSYLVAHQDERFSPIIRGPYNYTFLCLSLGSNQYRAGRVYDLCVHYDVSIRRLTESGFMEKQGIEPATPGL